MYRALCKRRHYSLVSFGSNRIIFAMELSIVILNWNVAGLLTACLHSLPSACASLWPHIEVIVVDNASTDDSLALLREEFPHVRVIALPQNVGFSAGNN